MSEYWKSNAKNTSINIHEQGKNHKDNVKAKLADIKKRTVQKQEEDRKYNATMAAIEKAALNAMDKDLEDNPRLKSVYGTNKPIAVAQAIAASSSLAKISVKKDDKKPKTDTKTAEKRKIDEPGKKKLESKIGEWQVVKEMKVEKPAPVIDLNLPSGNKMVKQLKLQAERDIEGELASLNEETDKKPKIDNIPAATVIKEETPQITEKVVTLKSSSASNKPITFKKRRIEGQQQRQRTDD